MAKTLEQWRQIIEREVPSVDLKPFSHNIITLALNAITSQYGRAEANRAINDFFLEDLGWSVMPEETERSER